MITNLFLEGKHSRDVWPMVVFLLSFMIDRVNFEKQEGKC